jgi:UDP-sugar pyrophosphorylase
MESLTTEQVVQLMLTPEYNQAHLFNAQQTPQDQEAIVHQLKHFDATYPGGIKAYIQRAKKLLEESANNVNPFEGFKPSVPEGESVDLTSGLDRFLELERIGLAEIDKCAFVLVAGGLGERLGYSSIKVGLPVELLTGNCYLQLYIKSILAIQERTGAVLPLAIMTSDDTHARTVDLLERNNYFGMPREQLTLMKQQLVPALIDNEARFAMENGRLIGKPHGHGDVHTLLYQHQLPQKWVQEGKRWVLFFQDTNALVFKVLPSFLGVSVLNNFHMIFLTLMRMPKEALGGIVKLVNDAGASCTLNIEYNQIDAMLKASGWHEDGDVNNSTLGLGPAELGQYSPFPGNSNTLLFNLPDYLATLQQTGGAVPEFVNPKYADATKTLFKSPTRLECMMQDYPKLLSSSTGVGFTQYDRWICFSAVKNSLGEAAAKDRAGLPPQSAGSGETDYYYCNSKLLELAGVHIEHPDCTNKFGGIEYLFFPRIVIEPSFAVSFVEIKEKVKGNWRVSKRSALILEGKETVVNNLNLDGGLRISNSASDIQLVHAKVPEIVGVEPEDPEHLQIRGFKLVGTELEKI